MLTQPAMQVLFKRKVVPPIPKQTFTDEEQEVL
jgi:hypothetical protein